MGNDGIKKFDILGLHCKDCWAEWKSCKASEDASYSRILGILKRSAKAAIDDINEAESICSSTCDDSYDWDDTGIAATLCKIGCSEFAGSAKIGVGISLIAANAAALLSYNGAVQDCRDDYNLCYGTWGEDDKGCPCEGYQRYGD